MNRDDFNMLNKDIIYFDNAATTLKPKQVIDDITEYYNEYSANAHRGDYDISLKVDNKISETRNLVKEFINAKETSEIVFTSNATDSINKIVFGYFKNILKPGDEVLLTDSEHASLILPWFELAEELDLKISYISLTHDLQVTLDNVKKAITPKTKVIALSHITNVVGDIRPIKEITQYAHDNNILILVDGAQSIPHMKVDVQDLDIDFLTFSAHKMCGPTGVGILYGKEKYLNNIHPIIFGGGMNSSFEYNGKRIYKDLPYLMEAGTPNIAGIIGLGSAIKYLNSIGMDNITKHEQELKDYALKKLKQLPNIIIYNETIKSGIITFNVKDIFPQDVSLYLNKYGICIRAGSHCAKMLKDEIGIKNTCRISFYFYNTKEEIDKLIEVLNNPNILQDVI